MRLIIGFLELPIIQVEDKDGTRVATNDTILTIWRNRKLGYSGRNEQIWMIHSKHNLLLSHIDDFKGVISGSSYQESAIRRVPNAGYLRAVHTFHTLNLSHLVE